MASWSRRETMTKKDLIQAISKEKKLHPNDVRQVVQAFLDEVMSSLTRGKRIEFRDFGVFEIVERKQKIGRNPKKADISIVIPAKNVAKFTPGKRLRALVESELISCK